MRGSELTFKEGSAVVAWLVSFFLGGGFYGYRLGVQNADELARERYFEGVKVGAKVETQWRLKPGVVVLSEPARDWDLADGAVVECDRACRFGIAIEGGLVYITGEPRDGAKFRLRPVSDLIVDRNPDNFDPLDELAPVLPCEGPDSDCYAP